MKYHTYSQKENGWTDWVQPNMEMYKMMCCDCGLVHNMKFRIEGNKVQFKVSRNNRATAASRRHKK